jgi:hypothetical protein
MSFVFHKYLKKIFQDKIKELSLELDSFSFSSPSLTTYQVKLKENSGYFFGVTIKSLSDFEYFEFRGDSSQKFASGGADYGSTIKLYTEWLKLIKTEKEVVLHEEKESELCFSRIINSISPKFQLIYNQALSSERIQLDELSGMGYRKAFEFLLKDYLIYQEKITQKEAQEIFKLQICVEKLNENYVLHKLTKYTSYLGNDFSHYYRKWINKEVSDLKEMINILVDWIDTTESHIEKMQLIEDKVHEKTNDFE